MPSKKQLWVLAGANGAGKSTFYQSQLAPLGLPFINADVLAKELYPHSPESHSYDAALLAADMRMQLLFEGRNFCFETVFSHPSKIDFVAQAKTLGYEIVLVFIHLGFYQLNHARISQRVKSGGHNVPIDKVEQRIPRTLANIKKALPLCDFVYILDNSSATDPFKQLITITNGNIKKHIKNSPEWLERLISGNG